MPLSRSVTKTAIHKNKIYFYVLANTVNVTLKITVFTRANLQEEYLMKNI